MIFAKPPEPGRVKTRLLPALSPQQAADVHRACLQDSLALVNRIPGCQKCLRVAAELNQTQELAAALGLGRGWRVDIQRGRNLGERLHEAFDLVFRSGCRKVVVVGTDTPWMSGERLLRALAWLDAADVVLGPCTDGGYYLLGARRLVPQMFLGIPWSTSRACEATLRALEKAHAKYRLLPRDFDLDRPEDLERAAQLLRRNPARAPQLAQWMNELKKSLVSRSSRRRPPARRSRRPRPGRA
jgi:rSAM/selenodomain-associated transferase 1